MKEKLKQLWAKPLLREFAVTLVLALGIFITFHSMVQSSVVLYSSMEPNLHEGQRIIISKVAYWCGEPHRDDIIIFPNPNNPDEGYIKRIIGMPGEIVEMKDGIVYIHKPDDTMMPLDETDYITQPDNSNFPSFIIPEGEYFVMGDNRTNSLDSRRGWTVPRDEIVGKAWLSVWPLSEFGRVPNYSFD